jgi:ketosteroid isomerase-like protein
MDRRMIWLAGAAATVIVASCAPRVDPEAEELAIQRATAATYEAFVTREFETLPRFISDDWVYYTASGAVWDEEATVRFFQERISEYKISLTQMMNQVSDDGTLGWTRYHEVTSYRLDGDPITERAVCTAILRKINGVWKMTHLHRTVQREQA